MLSSSTSSSTSSSKSSTSSAWLLLLAGALAAAAATAAPTATPTAAPTANPGVPVDDNQNSKRQPRKPPQEAYDACADADDGDTCSVTMRDRTVSGTCRPDRDDEDTLVCVPPPPSGDRDR